jgi:hypothetical protein
MIPRNIARMMIIITMIRTTGTEAAPILRPTEKKRTKVIVTSAWRSEAEVHMSDEDMDGSSLPSDEVNTSDKRHGGGLTAGLVARALWCSDERLPNVNMTTRLERMFIDLTLDLEVKSRLARTG